MVGGVGKRNREPNQKRGGRERGKNRENTWLDKIVTVGMGVGGTGFPRKDRRSWEYEFPEAIGKNRRMGNSLFLDGGCGECLQLLLSFFLPEQLRRVGGLSGKVQQIASQALTARYYKPPSGAGPGFLAYRSYFASRQLTSKVVSIFLPLFHSLMYSYCIVHSSTSSTSKHKASILPSFLSFSFSRVRGTH